VLERRNIADSRINRYYFVRGRLRHKIEDVAKIAKIKKRPLLTLPLINIAASRPLEEHQ